MTGPAFKLPGYALEAPLGAGGSGQVWRARERSSGAAVAVKLLAAVEPDQLAAVRSEAAMLSGLDHPHLLHLHAVVPCKQGLALVVDLAGGGSLACLLNARGQLSPGEVVTTVAPIGAALAYAHNAGVVHGDVSPANLLFTEVGLPLLADLGVARLVGDDSPVSSTPAYIDPAVAVGGVPAPSSDVFMLGAVALHALTGAPPWPGESGPAALAAAAAGDIGDVAARMRAAAVPEPVAEVVGRALELDAARRPTAAEFALDLRHAAEPVAVELAAGRASDPATSPATDRAAFTHIVRSQPRPQTHPRHRAKMRVRLARSSRLSLAAVAALVVVLAVVAVLWWPGEHAHQPSRSRPSTARAEAEAPASGHTIAATGTSTMAPVTAGQVLATLDAARARAFARRDPSLLAQVYSPGQLRSQDTSMIIKIVPDGCGLVGVHTDYTDVAVTGRARAQVVLHVRAVLRPSTLECAGTPAATAPGAPPTNLTLVLVRYGDRYLIDAITR